MIICVAGYPRSGTNWLQRLIVYSLNGYVPKAVIVNPDRIDPNHTINQFIKNPNKDIQVVRTHHYPDHLPKEVTHFVYIYRNVYDVIFSAYKYFRFYKKPFTNNIVIKKIKNIYMNISGNDPDFEKKISIYVKKFCKGELSFAKKFGKWDENIIEWMNFCDRNNHKATSLPYEQLHNDPCKMLSNVFDDLDIHYEKKSVLEAIEFLKIENYKKQIPDDKTTLHTMYKGQIGLGVEKFGAEDISLINKTFGNSIIELGYDTINDNQ